MAKEWIESIAREIKQKNREAAQEFGRAQHQAGIVEAQGRPFFADFVRCLEEDVAAIRAQLQGDPASAETTAQAVGVNEVKLARSRFPWFDAHIVHQDATITLDYAKDRGTGGDIGDRKTVTFAFEVDAADVLSVEEPYAEPAEIYAKPEDLARRVIEILFAV